MLTASDTQPVAVPAGPLDRSPARAALRVRELSATTVLIAAVGEIDASSTGDLFDAVSGHLPGHRQLVLDLSRVDFFGTAGYSLLHRIHTRCARTAIDWVLVTGPEVQRLLRVCDPDGLFPTAANIVSAVAALARGPHRTSQLGLRI